RGKSRTHLSSKKTPFAADHHPLHLPFHRSPHRSSHNPFTTFSANRAPGNRIRKVSLSGRSVSPRPWCLYGKARIPGLPDVSPPPIPDARTCCQVRRKSEPPQDPPRQEIPLRRSPKIRDVPPSEN